MPQLDRAIIVTQVFWMVVTLFLLYTIIVYSLIPILYRSLKLRGRIAYINLQRIESLRSEQQSSQRDSQLVLKDALSHTRKINARQIGAHQELLNGTVIKSIYKLGLNKNIIHSLHLIPIYKACLSRGLTGFSPMGYITRSN